VQQKAFECRKALSQTPLNSLAKKDVYACFLTATYPPAGGFTLLKQ